MRESPADQLNSNVLPEDARPRVLLGSGRSGTTWLLDVIAEANGLRPIFEPLKAVTWRVPAMENAMLMPGHQSPALRDFLELVFSGKFNSVWTDYRIIPSWLLPLPRQLRTWGAVKSLVRRWQKVFRNRSRYRPMRERPILLVKFIRANLMWSWIQDEFQCHMVFVIRHPGAVVESQLRLGGESWDPASRLDNYRRDPVFRSVLGPRYEALMSRILTPAEANTLIWCIENQWPIESAVERGMPVLHYELLQDGDSLAWRRLLDGLKLRDLPSKNILARPSQQASGAYLAASTAEGEHGDKPRKASWMTRLTAVETAQIQGVLDTLGVRWYRMDHARPLTEAGIESAVPKRGMSTS